MIAKSRQTYPYKKEKMIETHMRTKVQPFFDKVSYTICVPYHISPNMVTLAAFFTGIVAALFVSIDYLLLALLFLLLSGMCDILDGTVARITNQSQKIGAYIDLISDRMVEAAIILGFAFLYPQHYLAYIIFLIAVLLHFSTFVAAGALFPNMSKKSMHYDRSIVERAEAFVIFACMMLFPSFIFEFLMFFNLLVMGAGLTRFVRVLDYAKKFDS